MPAPIDNTVLPAVGNANEVAQGRYAQERMLHWDKVACKMDAWAGLGRAYHKRLAQIYQFQIPPGKRILEIGCGQGDLLAALEPERGVGIDFSGEMIQRAETRFPQLHFIQADVHTVDLDETFDVIILSDLVNDVWDVQQVFEQVARWSRPGTRLVLNFYSRLWGPPLTLARRLGLAKQQLAQNWLTVADIKNFLALTHFEVIRQWDEILLPLYIPLLSTLCNRFLVKVWPFQVAALTHFVVVRPVPDPHPPKEPPVVSVVVPARNEAGNIEAILSRIPEMGGGTEIVFVEGHSSDNTFEAIEKALEAHPERRCKLFRQTGKGKGDAVRLGFEQAEGDILMILDADMTVPPEVLPRFFEVLATGKGDFVNGVRLVYPMEKRAMRFWNLVGNKFFSLAFSWLLGQPIKDTLCGTKVLWKSEYEWIAKNRNYFGDFDPFGDFDLLFGAAKANLKIVEMPIRYGERTYGDTNIQRWKHGLVLLRMTSFAARRIKFV